MVMVSIRLVRSPRTFKLSTDHSLYNVVRSKFIRYENLDAQRDKKMVDLLETRMVKLY